MKKILVIGYTGSGKTTVGRMLADELGCKMVNYSDVIIKDYVNHGSGWEEGTGAAAIEEFAGQNNYRQAYVYAHKADFRDVLFEHGRKMETPDPSFVTRRCLGQAHVVCGRLSPVRLDSVG